MSAGGVEARGTNLENGFHLIPNDQNLNGKKEKKEGEKVSIKMNEPRRGR